MVEKPPVKESPKSLFAMSLGWSLSVGMVMLAMGGFFLDKKFGTAPWWTLSGVLLGFIYSGYEIWKAIQNIDKKGK